MEINIRKMKITKKGTIIWTRTISGVWEREAIGQPVFDKGV